MDSDITLKHSFGEAPLTSYDRRLDDGKVWENISDLRSEMSSVKIKLGEIGVILGERCFAREQSFQAAIITVQTAVSTMSRSISDFCGAQKKINEDLTSRISSLERSRSWLMGAIFTAGLLLGYGLSNIPI